MYRFRCRGRAVEAGSQVGGENGGNNGETVQREAKPTRDSRPATAVPVPVEHNHGYNSQPRTIEHSIALVNLANIVFFHCIVF